MLVVELGMGDIKINKMWLFNLHKAKLSEGCIEHHKISAMLVTVISCYTTRVRYLFQIGWKESWKIYRWKRQPGWAFERLKRHSQGFLSWLRGNKPD